MQPDLEIVQAEDGRADAVIDYLWALPSGESSFVTAIIPEQFRRRSMLDAMRRRTEFSLKVRLLKEPGVVISDVPCCAEGRGVAAARAGGLPRARLRVHTQPRCGR